MAGSARAGVGRAGVFRAAQQTDVVGGGPSPVDGAALELVWDVVARVDGGALDLVWDVASPVDGGALDVVWDLRSAVDGFALDLVWDVAVGLPVDGDSLDLVWDVRAAVDAALSLRWDVEGDAPVDVPVAGGPALQPAPWREVDAPRLTLRWGFVESPPAGRGALSEFARPEVAPAPAVRPWELPRKPVPIPAPQVREEKRKPAPVDGPAIRVPRRVFAPVDGAEVVLRWGSTGDAQELARVRVAVGQAFARRDEALKGLLERVGALEAAVAALPDREDVRAVRAEMRALEERLTAEIEALREQVAAVRDDAEAAILLSGR